MNDSLPLSKRILSSLGRGLPILLLLSSGCKQHEPASEPDLPKVNLKVEPVYARPLADALDLPGRVEADPAHLVHVYAPISGRLINMSLTPGQEVRKGQVIGTLQSGDVAQARADFDKGRIETLRADHALDRGKLLLAHEVMAQARSHAEAFCCRSVVAEALRRFFDGLEMR